MEHRLIHRTSTVKYNARTAEANAIVQDEERKQSLLREVGNASITADANQKSMLSQQAKIIGATTPQEQAELEAARQRLGESQAVYKNQADGKQSEYNTETGKITAMGAVEQSRRERLKDQPMGEIEQSKYARLDKANATPEQRKTNEANLQGIMNYTDTSTLEPITNAGVVETPQQFEERKAFIEKQNTEKATQDEIKRKKQEDIAAAGAASTAAGSKALERSKENPAPINDTAKMDRVSTMIDGIIGASGDPMGPVYKEMMMQDFQDMEDAKANAALSRDASIARAGEQDNDVQTLIDKYTKIHRENNAAYTKLLDETRDSQQKYLAEQEQRDKAKLAWDADMETQKLTKQKTQQLLSQSIQNALGGGAFSGAANEQLASTEREWDTAISNLAAEFSFKEADVSAFYTQKYVDTNNQFNMDVFNAAKALDEKIEGYALQGFNSIQARKNAEAAAENQYRTDVTTAKTTYTEAIKGYVKEINDKLGEEKKLKAQDAALDKRLATQEAAADRRLQMQLDNQDRQQANTDKKMETAAINDIRSTYNSVIQRPDVKGYLELKASQGKINSTLDGVLGSNDPNKVGAAKELVMTLIAKASDPTTGVRESEITKFGKNQTWVQNVQQANKAIFGGDMTGISQAAVNAYKELIDLQVKDQNQEAVAAMTPVIQSIVTHNNKASYYPINPADILPPEFLSDAAEAFNSYNSANEQLGKGYKFDWGSEPQASISTPPKIKDFNPETDLTEVVIGNKPIKVQPYVASALEQADAQMFAETGQHIQVNQHFRDSATQADLYKKLSAKGARVAPPGSSFHEKGLAIDVSNWEDAAPYLAAFGIVNGLSGDMGHFSVGEMNPDFLAQFSSNNS